MLYLTCNNLEYLRIFPGEAFLFSEKYTLFKMVLFNLFLKIYG